MIIYLGVSSPKPSSDLPESGPGRSLLSAWSCSGWGLHSPSRYRDGGSLLHCHSTLTSAYRRGGIISVALALESPPPDVIRHPALWSPDFPHLHPFVCAAAIICSTYDYLLILSFNYTKKLSLLQSFL